MMVAVFAVMLAALAAARFAPRRVAIAAMLIGLGLSAYLFLVDVHNRDYGFGLPWLKVEAAPVDIAA